MPQTNKKQQLLFLSALVFFSIFFAAERFPWHFLENVDFPKYWINIKYEQNFKSISPVLLCARDLGTYLSFTVSQGFWDICPLYCGPRIIDRAIVVLRQFTVNWFWGRVGTLATLHIRQDYSPSLNKKSTKAALKSHERETKLAHTHTHINSILGNATKTIKQLFCHHFIKYCFYDPLFIHV